MANFCKYCGEPLKSGSSFCGKCGRPVQKPVPRAGQAEQGRKKTGMPKTPPRRDFDQGEREQTPPVMLEEPPRRNFEQGKQVKKDLKGRRNSGTRQSGLPKSLIPLAAAFSVFAVILLVSLILFVAAKHSKGIDTSSPEKIVGSLLEQLEAQDMEGALACFSSEEAAGNFQYEKYVEVYDQESADTLLPAEDEKVLLINQRKLEGQAADQVASTIRVIGLGETAGRLSAEGVTPWKKLGLSKKEYVENVDSKNLKKLSVERVELAAQKKQNTDETQKELNKEGAVYGAQERREYVALYTVGETSYIQGFTVDCYDGEWKIFSMTSKLAGTPALGIPETAKKSAEFDEYTE